MYHCTLTEGWKWFDIKRHLDSTVIICTHRHTNTRTIARPLKRSVERKDTPRAEKMKWERRWKLYGERNLGEWSTATMDAGRAAGSGSCRSRCCRAAREHFARDDRQRTKLRANNDNGGDKSSAASDEERTMKNRVREAAPAAAAAGACVSGRSAFALSLSLA